MERAANAALAATLKAAKGVDGGEQTPAQAAEAKAAAEAAAKAEAEHLAAEQAAAEAAAKAKTEEEEAAAAVPSDDDEAQAAALMEMFPDPRKRALYVLTPSTQFVPCHPATFVPCVQPVTVLRLLVCACRSHEEKLRREREEKEEARKAEREAALVAALERKHKHDAMMQRIQAAVQDRFDEHMRRVFEHWLARTALRSSLLSCWQRWAISARIYALRAARRVKLALEPTREVSGVPVPTKEPWKDMHPKEEKKKAPTPVRRRSSAEPVTLPSIAAGDGGNPAGATSQAAGGGGGGGGDGANDDGTGDEEEEEEVTRVDPLARVVCDIEVDGGGQMYVRHTPGCLVPHAVHSHAHPVRPQL